jgi:hypothetical protein
MNEQLRERSIAQNGEEYIDERWERIKNAVTEVTQTFLWKQTSSNKECFDDECKKGRPTSPI